MLPVVISASIYDKNETACLKQVTQLIHDKTIFSSTVLIDGHSPLNSSEEAMLSDFSYQALSAWINGDQLCHNLMRSQATLLNKNKSVILDARYYDATIISQVLNIISETWFYFEDWQPAFILIVDDHLCLRFVNELWTTFYLTSLSTTRQDLHSAVKTMQKRILILRWLGFGKFWRLLRFIYRQIRNKK